MTELSETPKENTIVKFTVTDIKDYGVVGLIDKNFKGFIHVTDFSWTENLNPSDVFNVGDIIDAFILKIDEDRKKISLGIKQLTEDPWNIFFDKYKENEIVKFKINSVRDYGLSGIVDGKLEGFLHQAELSWNECLNPEDVFNVGEIIDAVVLEINEDRKRISLGVKQLVENPWETFCEKYDKGDIVKGEVCQLNHPWGGVVVKFTEGVTGVLLNSNMSYDEDYKHCLVKGQKIETILLSRDAGRQKINLGIKQINPKRKK